MPLCKDRNTTETWKALLRKSVETRAYKCKRKYMFKNMVISIQEMSPAILMVSVQKYSAQSDGVVFNNNESQNLPYTEYSTKNKPRYGPL